MLTMLEQSTLVLIKAACQKYAGSGVDWEQREYETAQALLIKFAEAGDTEEDKAMAIRASMQYSKDFINQLRNNDKSK